MRKPDLNTMFPNCKVLIEVDSSYGVILWIDMNDGKWKRNIYMAPVTWLHAKALWKVEGKIYGAIRHLRIR